MPLYEAESRGDVQESQAGQEVDFDAVIVGSFEGIGADLDLDGASDLTVPPAIEPTGPEVVHEADVERREGVGIGAVDLGCCLSDHDERVGEADLPRIEAVQVRGAGNESAHEVGEGERG